MHRSMDLIREILLAMEASADGFTQPIMLKGYSEEEIGYHCFYSILLWAWKVLLEGFVQIMKGTAPCNKGNGCL